MFGSLSYPRETMHIVLNNKGENNRNEETDDFDARPRLPHHHRGRHLCPRYQVRLHRQEEGWKEEGPQEGRHLQGRVPLSRLQTLLRGRVAPSGVARLSKYSSLPSCFSSLPFPSPVWPSCNPRFSVISL